MTPLLRNLSFVLLAASSCDAVESPAEANWRVEGEVVALTGESPASFELGAVSLGEALPSPGVTGRVITLETRSSPSFAALPGRVAELSVRIGDRVEEGDRLVRVQTGELSLLRSEVAAARLHVETKRATVDKLERMVAARLAAEHELTLAKAELAEAQLAAKTASARLRSLAVGSAGETSYWILANRSGAVVQLDAALGRQVRPDQDSPPATVADLDEVLVIADVSQREAARLELGGAVELSVPGSSAAALPGEIEFVSDVVDAARQTVPVRVRVDNRERRLRPNAFVDVRFAAGSRAGAGVMRVPAAAVVRDGDRTVVFVEAGAGCYRAQAVEIGRRGEDSVEIVGGLEPGERIVTVNALLLLNAIGLQG